MMYLAMGGIALIAIAFIILVTIRFQMMEAVYFREYGKKAIGEIVDVDKSSAEYHSGQKNQSYDIKVRFEQDTEESEEDKECTGRGVITADELAGREEGSEIEFYYDPMNSGKVIFYDPAEKAAKNTGRNKLALALMLAGAALFIAGRVML